VSKQRARQHDVPAVEDLSGGVRGDGVDCDRTFTFYPVKISDFVHIGPNCIVEAAQIGGGVEIGEGSIIVSAW
jgi:acetyltransferase-like isoleucine patch superfamily enzyme